MNKVKAISAEDFDRLIDEGDDRIDDYIDWSTARRPGLEAKRRGVTRQALIKMWLADRLDSAA